MRPLTLSFFFFFSLASTFFFFDPSPANAQSEYDNQLEAFAGEQGANYGEAQDPRLVVAAGIRGALTLVGTLFVAYMVYAGYLIMTAAGEEDKVKKGTDTIRRAIIGVTIVALSYSITLFVTRSLERATTDQGGFDAGISIEEGYRPEAPLCCEWQKGGRKEGGFIPDQAACRALCENSGAEAGSCRSYRTRQSDPCPITR